MTFGTPIDPELNRILDRIWDDFNVLLHRVHDAITAAGIGPGTCEAHILTRNRISRPPVHLTGDIPATAHIADEDVVALRRLLRNAKQRARELADSLDTDLGYRTTAKTPPADVRTDVRNAEVRRTAFVPTTGTTTHVNG